MGRATWQTPCWSSGPARPLGGGGFQRRPQATGGVVVEASRGDQAKAFEGSRDRRPRGAGDRGLPLLMDGGGRRTGAGAGDKDEERAGNYFAGPLALTSPPSAPARYP